MKVTSARKIAPTVTASSSKMQLSDNATLFTFVGIWQNQEVCAVRRSRPVDACSTLPLKYSYPLYWTKKMNFWGPPRTPKEWRIAILPMLVPWNCGCVVMVLTGIKPISHAPMGTLCILHNLSSTTWFQKGCTALEKRFQDVVRR